MRSYMEAMGVARSMAEVTPCGHPLSARRITVQDGRLVTDCWACAVQKDVISKIVGPIRREKHRDSAV